MILHKKQLLKFNFLVKLHENNIYCKIKKLNPIISYRSLFYAAKLIKIAKSLHIFKYSEHFMD